MSQINKIWILAGQSWINGQANQIPNLQAPYVGVYQHNSRVWANTQFEPIYSTDNNNQFPATSQADGCSVECYFKDIADILGDDIYLLKYAIGSTSLAISVGKDWNTASVAEYYDEIKAEITAIEAWMVARDKDFEWAGILWWQGENDSTIEADGLAYQVNMQSLYDGLNTATGTTLKIYQYNIELPPSGNRDYLAEVNTGKAAFTAVDTANRRLFDCDCNEWNADDIHPSVDEYLDIWNRVQKPLIITDL